jgi:hypothetical protein
LRQLFSSHVECNVREVSTAWRFCSHVPAAYVTYISSFGRIIIRPCQAIQKYQITDNTVPRHVDHILRLFRAYEAAMASTTIRAAWRQTGFEYENRNTTTYGSINEGQIREPRNFREIWMFDYHESQLSARRQKQKWWWINEHKFRKKERTLARACGVNDLIPEFRISPTLLSRSRTWDVREWDPWGKISMSCQRPLLIYDGNGFNWWSRWKSISFLRWNEIFALRWVDGVDSWNTLWHWSRRIPLFSRNIPR